MSCVRTCKYTINNTAISMKDRSGWARRNGKVLITVVVLLDLIYSPVQPRAQKPLRVKTLGHILNYERHPNTLK